MKRLMTPSEAAQLLEINEKTVLKWSRLGMIPAHPLGEGRRRLWRYLEAELVSWVESRSPGKGGL